MQPGLVTVHQVIERINRGQRLLLAGDEKLLQQLPPGPWIAGTIPYFVGPEGGLSTREEIYATELPEYVESAVLKVYEQASIAEIYLDIPENGFGFIIIPGTSQIHQTFALRARDYPGFRTRPLVGWVSGVHLDDLGKVTPKVFDGSSSQTLENQAVVMHVRLPKAKLAEIGILNIFEQGVGDVITFPSDGFIATEAYVDGKAMNLAEYITEKRWAARSPLVGDHDGVPVSVSLKSVDLAKGQVTFYGPVFRGLQYRRAGRVADYVSEFTRRMPADTSDIFFSCNCVLNYVYCHLEGKRTGEVTGPFTFGEIAYQLLNQTMVYLIIRDRRGMA